MTRPFFSLQEDGVLRRKPQIHSKKNRSVESIILPIEKLVKKVLSRLFYGFLIDIWHMLK